MAFAAVAVPWTLFPAPASAAWPRPLRRQRCGPASGRCCSAARSPLGLRRFGDRLPQVPEGDIVVIGERAARAAPALGEPLARAEGVLQRWPVAGIALLALMVILGAAILGNVG